MGAERSGTFNKRLLDVLFSQKWREAFLQFLKLPFAVLNRNTCTNSLARCLNIQRNWQKQLFITRYKGTPNTPFGETREVKKIKKQAVYQTPPPSIFTNSICLRSFVSHKQLVSEQDEHLKPQLAAASHGSCSSGAVYKSE